MLFEYFKQGINLGGYLSQYDCILDPCTDELLKKHLETFITEENICQIASWGFDHVRIPLDGYLFFDKDKKCLKEEPVAYLDRCVEWCSKHGLNVIIDLHNIYGHYYGWMDKPTPLMIEEELRDNVRKFWTGMAEHFLGYEKTKLMFELFNEMADATGYQWNKLYKETIREIRHIDADRWVLVGSNCVNSVAYLDRLDLVDDPHVFYNFHYYEPNVFTHQKAHFSEEFREFNHTLTYPGDMTAYLMFLKSYPKYAAEHPLMTEKTVFNNRELMLQLMKDAEAFTKYSGCELYCGEFGVIDSAPEEEAVKWLKDFMTICNDLHIGHAMWNYKALDFEILNEENEVVRPKVLELLREMNV